jgi:hypothetical protein
MSEFQAAGVTTARDPAASMVGFFPHEGVSARMRPVPGQIAESADEYDNPFQIHIASDASRRRRASSLIERRYAWRGYSTSPLEEDAANGRVTMSAHIDDTTVATITAGLDADEGLYVGQLYPEEVAALRAQGRKLCEFTRLAVDESVRGHAILGSIFHVACMYVINLHRCTDVLIEVNPRHVRFYQRMLGFQRAADERMDPAVKAPAVLLRLDLAHCAREIARLGGQRKSGSAERSFYPFFFGPDDTTRILGRLRGH